MSRGEISQARLDEIHKRLPDIAPLKAIQFLCPETISLKLGPKNRMPIAAVCLNDARLCVGEASYALMEAYAHEAWYMETSKPPKERPSTYFVRYYSDDVSLRLYAASEHLANAIIAMLPITAKSLSRNRRKPSSLSHTVGKYLQKERPRHALAGSILTLVKNESWKKAIQYRNQWVHSQPPLVSGFGIRWQRKMRWTETVENGVVTGHSMVSGGEGDKPELSPEELRSIMTEALAIFVDTLRFVANFYRDVLVKKGFQIRDRGLGFKLP